MCVYVYFNTCMCVYVYSSMEERLCQVLQVKIINQSIRKSDQKAI